MGTVMFILAIILVVVGIGALVFVSGGGKGVGVLMILIGVLAFVLSISTVVQAKNIGVVTSYGKPVGSMTPGYHTKKPWESVTDIDGTIQKRIYKGNNCLWVRIGDGSRSCVSLVLRWRANPSEADTIFADYRSDNPTEEVGDSLVSPQLKQALQKTLGTYNPCASLQVVKADQAAGGVAKPASFAPDMDQMSTDLKNDLSGRSDLVKIDDVNVTYVTISDNTQKCLDDFTKNVGQTIAAQQNKETSLAQAAANQNLQGSVSPEINQARCLDALNAAIEKKYQLPAGFNCLGTGSGVVVSAGK